MQVHTYHHGTFSNLKWLPILFRLQSDSIPVFTSPRIYAVDFNYRSTTRGYSSSNPDGDTLEDFWAVFHKDCNRFNVYFLFQLQNLIEIVSAVIISKYRCIKPHEINFR